MNSNSNNKRAATTSPIVSRVNKKKKKKVAKIPDDVNNKTSDQQQIARSLKTFQALASNKEKAFYLCHCTETGLNAFSQLFKQVLRGQLDLPADILKQLKPLTQLLRTVTSSRVTPVRKRKILANVVVRSILYPLLRKYIIPLGLKWLGKVTGRQFITEEAS